MEIPFPRSLTSVTMAGPEYAYPLMAERGSFIS
jgi:hypothetical protein